MNYPSYLIHYGVKGQHWGERQYQNPDGTYTELGKERRRLGNNYDLKNSIYNYKKNKKIYDAFLNRKTNQLTYNEKLRIKTVIKNMRESKDKIYEELDRKNLNEILEYMKKNYKDLEKLNNEKDNILNKKSINKIDAKTLINLENNNKKIEENYNENMKKIEREYNIPRDILEMYFIYKITSK